MKMICMSGMKIEIMGRMVNMRLEIIWAGDGFVGKQWDKFLADMMLGAHKKTNMMSRCLK